MQHFQKRTFFAKRLESAILKTRIITDKDTARLFSKSVVATTYTVGGLTLLGTLGVDTKPLLASLSVTGVSVGFALKDVFSNFVCGVSLILQREFKAGDTVKICGSTGIEGVVESIDYRYVKLKTEKGMILIPSQIVHGSTLEVIKRNPE